MPAQAMPEFVAWGVVTHGWKPRTIYGYLKTMRRFVTWLEANGTTLARADRFAYSAFLQTLPPTAASVNQAVKPLRRYGEWLVDSGRKKVSPAEHLRTLKQPVRVPRPFSPAQVVDIMARAADDGAVVVVAVSLQVMAGLRYSEMRLLRWDHVDADSLYIVGKGAVARRIPLNRRLRGTLFAWRALSPPSPWVLPASSSPAKPIPERTLRDLMRPALNGERPHRCRATFLTEVGKVGGSYAVRDLAGHASVGSSDAYVRYEEPLLRECVEALPYAS